jgi:hypothetical protein
VIVLRRFWPLVVAAILLLVTGFGAAAGSLPLRPAQLNPPDGQPPATWDPHLPSRQPEAVPTENVTAQRIELPSALVHAVQLLCLLLVVGVVILLVVLVARSAVRRTRDALPLPRAVAEQSETAREVLEAVDRGLMELDDGDADPRRAVIACWVRLERAAEAAGVPRRPGDTSTDLVVRLLADRQVNSAVLGDFASVYREARYSPHTVDETMRGQARAALRLLRDELAAQARSSAEPTAQSAP